MNSRFGLRFQKLRGTMQLKRSKKTLAPTSHFVQWQGTNPPIFWILVVMNLETSVSFSKEIKCITHDRCLVCWPLPSLSGRQLEGEIVGFEAGDGQKPRVKLMDGTVVTAVTGGAGRLVGWWNWSSKSVGIDIFFIFCGVLLLKYFCFLRLDSHDMR